MKVKAVSAAPAFQPVEITITFETQRELEAFGSLFNTSAVAKALRDTSDNENMPDNLRDAVTEAGGRTSKYVSSIIINLREYFK